MTQINLNSGLTTQNKSVDHQLLIQAFPLNLFCVIFTQTKPE